LLFLIVQRIFLYPFSSKSFVEVLITAFWLFPEIYKAEKKMGSIRLLWTLFSLFTIPPAIVYIFVTQILRRYTPEVTFASISYFGMAGWVVGLVIANYLKYDTNDDNQRM
jgi:membrane associated rhomboid family serine protease